MNQELTLVSIIKQLLILTQRQLFISFLLTFGFFFIEYSAIIFREFEAGSGTPEGQTTQTATYHIAQFLNYLSSLPHANDIATAFFWALTAVVLYVLYFVAQNIIIDAKNEIVIDTNYAKDSIARVLIIRFTTKILVALGFFGLVAVTWLFLIPYWTSLLSVFVYSGLLLQDIPLFAIGIVGLAFNLYAILAAVHFIFMDMRTRSG
ncbi:MAG: hypothetical protein ACR2FM_02315 [Candidatus Saccharimonadales bacterium]